MNKLLQLLRTPYPSLVSLWKAILVPTALIFLILGVLQPFGIAHAKAGSWSIAAVSALIAAAASCACNLLLPTLFPAYYDERRWTIGKEMLHLAGMFLLIATGVCLWVAWLTGTHPGVRLFFTYANNSGAEEGEQDFEVEVAMDPATAALLQDKVSAWLKPEQR